MVVTKSAKRWVAFAAAAAVLAMAGACSSAFKSKEAEKAAPQTWEKTATGVIINPTSAAAHKVRLEVMTDGIIHVTASVDGNLDPQKSLLVQVKPEQTKFDVTTSGDTLTLKTDKVSADVSLSSGKVVFHDASGKAVLSGYNGGQFTPVKVDGKDFYAVRQEFNRGTDEGFYGLGQHQNGQMNYNGEDVILAQHNMDVAVPMVVSTNNYGVLWDNYSITRFGYPKEYDTLSKELKLRDASGKEGGLTARYYVGGKLKVEQVEADPNYQFIPDQKNFPDAVKVHTDKPLVQGAPPATYPDLKVVYDGTLETDKTGVHKFRFYVSGYFKLWIDGKLVMDSWRQGWQGWYRNYEMEMTAGKPVKFHAEWQNEGGAYLRFLHLDPLPDAERHELSLSSDVAHNIDYYFIAGSDMDDVVAGYRHLTGQAAMLPKWAYGFWQSRQRYNTQQQLVDVVKEYRKLNVPLDAIVQDWRYWKDPAWGSHDFDESRFPNPQKMVDDVHNLHAHLMIVIWPKFYSHLDNYKEFDKLGLMYRYAVDQGYLDWVGPGYKSSNYDAYSQAARDIYWKQIAPKLDVLGPDAWWMDNDEPDMHSNMPIDDQIKMRGPTAYGPGAQVYNTYPLMHVCGFYDHWAAAHPDQRTFILTRSGFAGMQRCSAGVWSGDVVARWSDMRDQISAGVNFSMSGVPNWSMDIGGYTMESRFGGYFDDGLKVYTKPKSAADLAEFTELYTRWYAFGAFAPVFRSHGEVRRREIYEMAKPGSETFKILDWYTHLRYRLLPYIYTQAASTYHKSGTLMRGLVMDFGADKKVWNIADEYMFGKSFLVAPVTEYKAKSRSVYLPAGADWYDFFSGKKYSGGQSITAVAPLKQIPVYVKAGAIIPTGPDQQYTDQKPNAPIVFVVYTGADGKASLYEDDGKSNGYRQGKASGIALYYNDKTATLTIGARMGSFDGMLAKRVFKVRFISGPTRDAVNFDAKADATVAYDGHEVKVTRPAGK